MMCSSSEIEQLLGKLLLPDNNEIRLATEQLCKVFKHPQFLPELGNVLVTSQHTTIRQYAALLLRRKLSKSKSWKSLPQDVGISIKATLLQVIIQEQEVIVKRAIAQVIGVLAKHDLADNKWPELFEFITKATRSASVSDRELGMMVLSTVSATAPAQMKPHGASLLQLFSATLEDTQSRLVPFYTIQSMTHLVFEVGCEEMKAFQVLVPKALNVIRQLVLVDEEQACEALELFDELVECEVAIVVPHIKLIVEFCLEVASNQSLNSNIRVKALSFISWLTRLKKKSILKYKLVKPILNVLFPILCTPPEDESDTELDEDINEGQSPGSASSQKAPAAFAQQVIDVMALHLPPEKIVPLVLQFVEPAMQSSQPFERRAAYFALAVCAEGCADFIKSQHLKSAVGCVCQGMKDDHPAVRSAALFALGQFSEHLQPEISDFASTILPLLFDYLGQVSQRSEERTAIDKTYYALEMFCENLGENISSYLPSLMQHTLLVLGTESSSLHLKELAISSIGAMASAAKMALVPYFSDIMGHLKNYLTVGQLEDTVPVQLQALDTLGTLARTLGSQHFLPLCPECVQMGLDLLEIHTDPDLRRCVYGLFSAVSSIKEFSLEPYIASIVRHLVEAVQSSEGIIAHYDKEDNKLFQFFDEDDVEDEEEDGEEVQGFSVENAYLEEKQDACSALGEIAINSSTFMMPYLEDSFRIVLPLLEHLSPEVRREAVTCCSKICAATYQVVQVTQSEETNQGLSALLKTCVPKFLAVIKSDLDRMVVMTTLEALKTVIDSCSNQLVSEFIDSVSTCIKCVFQLKMACQDQDDGGDDEEQEAEYDAMVLENAGEVIPSLAKVAGGAAFAPYFAGLLPVLLKKLKNKSTVADRSFACGVLAETAQSLDGTCSQFVQVLCPVFTSLLKDDDDEVRNNAVFGLGILAFNAPQVMEPHFPELLKNLVDMVSKESNPSVMDNICGALCRMMLANSQLMPTEQVFSVILQYLPLREDLEEYSVVLQCVCHLSQTRSDLVLKSIGRLVAVFGQALGASTVSSENEVTMIQLLRSMGQSDPQSFQLAMSGLPQEVQVKLQNSL